MNEKLIYTVILNDGTKLTDLFMNGNNFVSTNRLTEDIFEDNLNHVTIIDSNNNIEEHEYMMLIQLAHYDDGDYFILMDIPKVDLERAQIQANIDYIAMETGVDLEV